MKAGKRAMDDYIAEWRKTQAPCGDDLEAVARRGGGPARGRVRPSDELAGAASRPAASRSGVDRGRGDDPDRRQLGHPRGRHRLRPAVRRSSASGSTRPAGSSLAEEMKAGDFSRVERDVVAQVEAGAHMLDVNAGIPLADEPAILARTIQLVQSLTDVPLSIDSSIVAALEAGLAVYQGKALVNSVTGEDERLERVLPLVRKYGAAVVAISTTRPGISEDPDVRFAVAKRIVERAADHGIPREDIIVDPLAHADRGDARRPAGRSSGSSAGCATS